MTLTLRSGHGRRLSQSTLQTTPLSQEVRCLYLVSRVQVLYPYMYLMLIEYPCLLVITSSGSY